MAGTLAEKVWDAHVVRRGEGEPDLLYIDLHLLHEVTSPQAFDGLRLAGRPVRRPDLTLATEDHNVPTTPGPDHRPGVAGPRSRRCAATARSSASASIPMGDAEQGIVHVVGPQLGPDPAGHDRSSAATATPRPTARSARSRSASARPRSSTCSPPRRCRSSPFKTMAINVDGELRRRRHRQGHRPGRHRQDRHRRRSGLRPRVPRRAPSEALSMEARMTVCNMSIEAGARAGMIAPDETTFDYLKGRPHAPDGADWDAAVADVEPPAQRRRRRLRRRGRPRRRRPDAVRHLGHQPRPGRSRSSRGGARPRVHSPTRTTRPPPRRRPGVHGPRGRARRCATSRSTPSSSARAPTAGSRTCAPPPPSSRATRSPTGVRMLVVPGSARVRLQAEAEGLDAGLHRGRRRVAPAPAARCAWA